MTPEGKIKHQVKKLLSNYTPRYEYWPVPAGYGPSSLDCLLCYRGIFIAIETKAPGKKPTDRQQMHIKTINDSGGFTIVIDGSIGLDNLRRSLDYITTKYPNDRYGIDETPGVRGGVYRNNP